jgi:hypothetical protein
MPPVTKTQLQTFRKIKKQFGVPRLQAAGKWRTFSNDDIWICIVSQVVVVGRAAPGGRLWEKENRRRIRWNDVVDLSPSDAEQAIWKVLRDIGTRFCSKKGPRHCSKTAALMRNLEYLRNHPKGPQGFLKSVAKEKGSLNRVHFVMRELSYIKNKGARDLLMSGFGMVKVASRLTFAS